MGEGSAGGVMEHLNWGYIQLDLVALVFGGLQRQGKTAEVLDIQSSTQKGASIIA